MKYILMMHSARASGDYEINSWKPEEVQAHMEYFDRLNKDLANAGELVEIRALTPPRQAKLVRAGRKGKPITDGPFAETKEFLAGFWVVDVESEERANEIAARASAAPGPGGTPLMMSIEVREIMELPSAP